MTKRAVAEHDPALKASRRELEHFDSHRDLYDRRRRIQLLSGMGMEDMEIEQAMGLPRKSAFYHKNQPPPPTRPLLYDSRVSDQRAEELESRADLALRLAVILRDEDPAIVWGTLCRLSRRELQELAVIALAAIPVDATRRELLGWVEENVRQSA